MMRRPLFTTFVFVLAFITPAFADADHHNKGDGRSYLFSRLSMPTGVYSIELVQLFDEKDSFADLERYLRERGIAYSIDSTCEALADFPKQLQAKLLEFGVNDNVVIRGKDDVVILKIKAWYATQAQCTDALATAKEP